ncbi:MAG: hypothetical protein GXP34_01490 [Actinobacteria bacterium]|nr:hypothetical protein [Actinomycetota bacterium]
MIDRLLTTLGVWSPLLVFALAMGESAAFLGLFLPGEVTVILGGVLAGTGVVPLWAMLIAAVLGAVIGDSVGFWMGGHFGPAVLRRPRLARFAGRLDAAETSLARRGWSALVVARFTSFLRAVVPFAAGMAKMPYGRFVVGNVVGGVLWGSSLTLMGYLAGDSWQEVEHWLLRGGLTLAGALVVLGVIVWASRWVAGHREKVLGWLDPLLRTRVVRALADRLEGPSRRVAPLLYLWPVALVIVGGLWLFGGLLQDVLGQEEFFFFDKRALEYVATHQIPAVVQAARWLATTTPQWMTMVVGAGIAAVMLSRRYVGRAIGLVVAIAGQWLIVEATRLVVDRSAPSLTALGSRGDYGFPSEYIAALVTLLVILAWPWRPQGWRATTFRFGAAMLIAAVVGFCRLVLLLEYPSDVLAGAAVGAGWTVMALSLADPRIRTILARAVKHPRE